jgi:predicted unusual protein kinase regulating ubiquinone biosynthesis (AarF/ABC1/UbiB family)
VKFGQLVASAPGVFGDAVAAEFRDTLDTGPQTPWPEVREQVEHNIGMPLERAFAKFERDPIGRASIAVVHRAITIDGRQVAVKVLRPGIEHTVATDLALFGPLLAIVARETGDLTLTQMLQLLEGFKEQIGEELDLRNEARAMHHYRRLLGFADLPLVTVPEPDPLLSGPDVLTMELLDGVPIDDLAGIASFGYDPMPLVDQVIRAFFVTTVRFGNFHGDIHAGNLLMLRDGRIGVLDWGIVGRLDAATHRFFRSLLEAALGDEQAWVAVAEHLTNQYGAAIKEGLGLSDEQLPAFIRAVCEPILTQPFGEVSLSALLSLPQTQAAQHRNVDLQDKSLKGWYHRLREQRKVRDLLEAEGMNGVYDRGTFLLSKQLLYFERYGKMFLGDRSIIEDREFFVDLLARPSTLDQPA